MTVEDVKDKVPTKDEDMVKSEDSQEDLGLKTVQPGPSAAGITDRNLLKQTLLEIFASHCEKAGGPVQFLEQNLNRERLDELLLKVCPWMDSIEYVQPSLLGKREKALVHITMLSHEVAASTKGYPFASVCCELAEDFLVHGFLTEAQPLLLWTTPADREASQQSFKVRYVKGMARCSSLLLLLAIIMEENVDLSEMFPDLFHSIQMIHVLFESHADLASVAIANAHASNRGAIRATHDIMTWVCKLRKLEAGGSYQPSEVLERFNAKATGKASVSGNKRTAALNLLQSPCKTGVTNMLDLLSKVGSKRVWWNEDSFCNKKLMPGFAPRTTKPDWQNVLNVTEMSFNAWVDSLNQQQLNKSPAARRPLDKSRLEEHSALSAFWCWAKEQALGHALSEQDLEQLHTKFLNGDIALQLDLQSLLHERKKAISFLDVKLVQIEYLYVSFGMDSAYFFGGHIPVRPFRKCLRELNQKKVTCTDLALVGQAKTEIEAGKFEAMEFELLKEKLKNDIAATKMYRSKLDCHETLLYHAKVEHTRKRRLQALDAVEELFKGAVAKFSFDSTIEHVLNGLLQLKKEYRVDRLPVLLVVNWASPSTARDEQMELQAQVLQQILSQEEFEPMGLVVMPVWERAKGSLYKSETLLLKSLSEKDINMDEKASLSFEDVLSFKNVYPGFSYCNVMFPKNYLYNNKTC